ncbi:hypothetical protein OWV82_023056 [Melia azedarach]|uniref:Uncharacterized protein n=1 Tax=Melia azedarach TaxID=155640 RepID=A0ACC1WW09_MELAZ|nr:hypothetical protein OWV82_023056 [Melia azedarach]
MAAAAAAIPATSHCPPVKTKSPPLSPFSAVAPSPFLAVSRLHIRLTLETIYEEETDHQEDSCIINETSACIINETSATSFFSTCNFFQLQKASEIRIEQVRSN